MDINEYKFIIIYKIFFLYIKMATFTDLPNEILELILYKVIENEFDLTNLSLVNSTIKDIINVFIENIKMMSDDKIYELFMNKNPLVLYVPKYRKNINYYKAITYLYYENEDGLLISDEMGTILTTKIRKIYKYLSNIIDDVMLSEINYIHMFTYILDHDDVELYKLYKSIINEEQLDYIYFNTINSYAINMLKYIIETDFDTFSNKMINYEYEGIDICSSEIFLYLLDYFTYTQLLMYSRRDYILQNIIYKYDDDGLLLILKKIQNQVDDNFINMYFLRRNKLETQFERYFGYMPKSVEFLLNKSRNILNLYNYSYMYDYYKYYKYEPQERIVKYLETNYTNLYEEYKSYD